MLKKITYILVLICTFLIAAEKPYVLLISFDGFRWDYTDKAELPNFNYLINHGVKASSLQPVFPSKTFPNHYSIITGMYPVHHNLVFNDFTDPRTGERYQTKGAVKLESKWYGGEPFWVTADKNGIRTASVFWVGSTVNDPQRRPDYFNYYNHTLSHGDRVSKIINYLQLPEKERPHFLTLYFPDTDDIGHRFGPDSPQIIDTLKTLDVMLGDLFSRLKRIHMLKKINIILVSDHGMISVDSTKSIPLKKWLNGYHYHLNGHGPVTGIVCDSKKDIPKIYKLLKTKKTGYSLYYKNELPRTYHFSDNMRIGDIVVIAHPKYWLKLSSYGPSKGAHGYDNHFLDMQGIFMAMGPAFKSGYKTGTVRNIDIYPLLCKIFEIKPAKGIDGSLDRIEYVLKGK